MIYTPLYEAWFYSYVDIPDLDKIVAELILLKQTTTNIHRINEMYENVLQPNIINCPNLEEYLRNVGLYNNLNRILFSSNVDKKSLVHVDSYNPIFQTFSLNIPLIECENSYTAWYSTTNKILNDLSRFGLSPETNFAYSDEADVTEVYRVEYTRPMLINTTILHRGIADNPRRTIASIRFNTMLSVTDMRNMGIHTPLVQI
jgi:hypothetical protein